MHTVTASRKLVNLPELSLSASPCHGKVKWVTPPQSHYILGVCLVLDTKPQYGHVCAEGVSLCASSAGKPIFSIHPISRLLRQPAQQPIGIIRVRLQQAQDLERATKSKCKVVPG